MAAIRAHGALLQRGIGSEIFADEIRPYRSPLSNP